MQTLGLRGVIRGKPVRTTREVAADFLRNLIKKIPCQNQFALTDNGTHFTDPKGESWWSPRSQSPIGCRLNHAARSGSPDSARQRRCPAKTKSRARVRPRFKV
jgi:hypothetical protein